MKTLEPRYQEIWKRSGIYHAIKASTHSVPRDKMVILGVAEFWCCDTNTFVFPWGEVTISLEDIVLLGCLSVLGCSILTPCEDIDVYNCLRSEIKCIKLASGGSVTPCMWMEYIMNSGKDVEHEAFLVFWLFRGRFCNVAVHLSRGNKVALAPLFLHVFLEIVIYYPCHARVIYNF